MCTLESDRLILRPPRPSDITAMTVWLSDYDVAKMTARVPYPYYEAYAEDFIAAAPQNRFVIARKDSGLFWGLGYATEAARRLVKFAFEELDQGHVSAGWYHDNPASGHVLAKLGARHNGSKMRDCAARGRAVLCHDMLLTRADFLRKQAA